MTEETKERNASSTPSPGVRSRKTLRGGHDPSIGKATQFRPGQSGNPSGVRKARPILKALEEAIESDPQVLKKMAQKVLRQASLSHQWFAEVRDTLDGRPIQAVQLGNLPGEKLEMEVNVGSARAKLMQLLGSPDAPDDTPSDT